MDIIPQIFSLLTTPPGNLIYHLGLCFAILAALQTARFFAQTRPSAPARRMVFGLSLLLAAQLILFIASGLAWQGLINPQTLLPPLDRAITVFSLLWIVWLWAYPERVSGAEAAFAFINIITAIALAFSLVFWADLSQNLPYNLTWYDFAWELFGLAVVLLGILALLIRRPAGWGTGLAMFLLILAGYLAQLFINLPAADFPGALRLALLAAYPLLMILPQRLALPAEQPAALPVPARPAAVFPPHPITQERRRYSTDPKTLHAFLQFGGDEAESNLPGLTARVVGHAMLADLSFLVSMPDPSGWLNLEGGYDLIREEYIPGAMVSVSNTPLISAALEKGRSLTLSAEELSSPDLHTIADTVGLSQPGNLLLVPLLDEDEEGRARPVGGVLLLSPYAHRAWSSDDVSFISPVSRSLVRIVHRYRQVVSTEKQLQQALADLETVQMQNSQIRQSYQDLLEERNAQRQPEPAMLTQEENMAALVAVQQEYQQIIERLQSENESLQQAAARVTDLDLPGVDEKAALQQELVQLNDQVTQLRASLTEANRRLLDKEKPGSAKPMETEQAEVIASVAQELRQPLSSITGYTDLLMGESVGILGALQRKFLERIKASTERMRGQVDDLIHTIALESGSLRFSSEPVDLGSVIDEALMVTSAQIREKNITLRVDLPDELPALQADRDALQQIVIHLLQNAGSATPVEGSVSLRVRLQSEKNQPDFVLLQVTDSGGGIPAEDLPRVFSRLYRTDNLLIQGVGDTGVGLSIARSLVEAHGGRIWVDSQPGQTSTFSVLLPVQGTGDPVRG